LRPEAGGPRPRRPRRADPQRGGTGNESDAFDPFEGPSFEIEDSDFEFGDSDFQFGDYALILKV
jgi:hypothetical protein